MSLHQGGASTNTEEAPVVRPSRRYWCLFGIHLCALREVFLQEEGRCARGILGGKKLCFVCSAIALAEGMHSASMPVMGGKVFLL